MKDNELVAEGYVSVFIKVLRADSIYNTAPYFKEPIQNLKLVYGVPKNITLPEYADDENDQVIISITKMPLFVSLSFRNLTLTPTEEDIGIYELEIVLSDFSPN